MHNCQNANVMTSESTDEQGVWHELNTLWYHGIGGETFPFLCEELMRYILTFKIRHKFLTA